MTIAARARHAVRDLSWWRALLVIVAALPALALVVVAPELSRTWLLVILVVLVVGVGAAVGLAGGTTARGLRDLRRGAASAPDRPARGEVVGIERRLQVVEEALNASTRRAWEPARSRWPSPHPRPVLLLPAADYHLAELVPLADALERRGVPTALGCGEAHWPRLRDGLVWYPDVTVHELPPVAELASQVAAVVTMSDWGGYQDLIEHAREQGLATFGKVEGVVDFAGVDDPEARHRYRRVGHVLAQGDNDAATFDDVTVVGSSRLERLLAAPPVAASRPLVVINQNFTYGSFPEYRTAWLRAATGACEALDVPYVVSLHPAEKARGSHPNATPLGIARLLPHATALISRFSAAPYEALGRGVPFVYFNPHGERVPNFTDPRGAFAAAASPDTLRQALATALDADGASVRDQAWTFLAAQIDVREDAASEERAAEVILRYL